MSASATDIARKSTWILHSKKVSELFSMEENHSV